jgi:hypothetical protein
MFNFPQNCQTIFQTSYMSMLLLILYESYSDLTRQSFSFSCPTGHEVASYCACDLHSPDD